MTLIEAIPAPLSERDGLLFVTGTRVPLDTVIGAFLDGESAEGIVDSYPTLELKDVYACLAYYLHHRDTVDDYLRDGASIAAEVRKANEMRFPSAGWRERLLARRKGP